MIQFERARRLSKVLTTSATGTAGLRLFAEKSATWTEKSAACAVRGSEKLATIVGEHEGSVKC